MAQEGNPGESQVQVCRPGCPLSLLHCMRGCDLPPITLNSWQVKSQEVSPTLASLQLRITLQKAAAAFPMTVLASARSCLPASLKEALCLLATALFSVMILAILHAHRDACVSEAITLHLNGTKSEPRNTQPFNHSGECKGAGLDCQRALMCLTREAALTGRQRASQPQAAKSAALCPHWRPSPA